MKEFLVCVAMILCMIFLYLMVSVLESTSPQQRLTNNNSIPLELESLNP